MNKWINASVQKPPCEEEVLIKCRRAWVVDNTKYECIFYTTAMYEDGTMNTEDTMWNWYDCDFQYDEENDWYIIPEGWWEYKHFNNDEEYNNEVDCGVMAWSELPPTEHHEIEIQRGEKNG